MHRTKWLLLLGLVCMFGCTSKFETTVPEVEAGFEASTETNVKLVNGDEWKAELASREGKVVVVDLWASW